MKVDNEYLSGVTVNEVTEICDRPLDNIYADMLRRSGMPFDTNAERIDFLAAMMKAHDTVKRRTQQQDDGRLSVAEDIRDRLAEGESIIDISAEFESLPDAVRHLTSGVATIMETWEEPYWAYIETVARDFERGIQSFANEEGVSFTTARRLLDWYRNRTVAS